MIPMDAGTDSLSFQVVGALPDGTTFTTVTHKIGVAR